MPGLTTMWKAACELGWRQTGLFVLYQFQKRSSWLRWRLIHVGQQQAQLAPAKNPFKFPDFLLIKKALGENGLTALLAEADEIVSGKVRLFGGEPVPLCLEPQQPLKFALDYGSTIDGKDIKFTWEPARFGWAVVLARAFAVSGDPIYAQTFWKYLKVFTAANPVYMGPNWTSGQEVALRLTALVFAGEIFRQTGSREDCALLAGLVEKSAQRVDLTLAYAQAQNNNHLLTEALGLLTAGIWLGVKHWEHLGLKWLSWGYQHQITADGEYCQHSTNYHRLMLQTALWMNWMCGSAGIAIEKETLQRLEQATQWLLAKMDLKSGQAMNLGNNDGALILPLSVGAAWDYRNVAQAASRAFLGKSIFPAGEWDEASIWLGLPMAGFGVQTIKPNSPERIDSEDGWAALRAVKFTDRPAHADQLHVDLWWRGENIAQDAGTYIYNGEAPWNNSLVSATVHNTVMVGGREPMQRAGQFLWLDWDQAEILPQEAPSGHKISARRLGYSALGINHQRSVENTGRNCWKVTDQLLALKTGREHRFSIQWLLQDWEWQLDENVLILTQRRKRVEILLRVDNGTVIETNLVRAGELLSGSGEINPIRGWVSPTYGVKLPALSLRWTVKGSPPVTIITEWKMSDANDRA